MTNQIAILVLFSLGQQAMPTGPQPQFAIVRSMDKALGEVTLLQIQAVSEVVPEKTIINGVEVTRNVIRQVLRTVEKSFSIEKGTVLDTAGKKVPAAEVWKRLKVGATVLVAGQQIDPLYLRIVQPETLIFITSPSPIPLPKLPPPKV
jgi:hypothetical protein